MRRFFVSIAICCAVGLASHPANSQAAAPDAGQPSLSDSLKGQAKEAYESAKILLNNRDPAGAFTKFQQAYDLSGDPRLRFNMAVCARDLRAYAKMQKLLLLYEKESGTNISAEDKADVDAALATIRGFVGTVKVAVNEPGATVVVDGDPVGVTPLPDPLVVDLGRHTVVVRKTGFDPVDRTIEIAGGNETALAIDLVARHHTGRLVVVAESGAIVVVDKKQVGTGRFDGTLPSGTHEIQVTASGKRTYEALVDLRESETRSLQVTLMAETRGPVVWPWIVGGAVVAAGAAVGAYFVLRPHDERGPLPTGTIGSIELSVRSGRP